MSSLDMTVVNVALPHMQGNLSASPDQITWILTSYIIATAIMTPMSGWLVARFGLKSMLLTCVAGFTTASVLCGVATSLPQIVLSRLLQGAFAAPLFPASQAVLLNINPPERIGRAMAIFTMATFFAPVVGPIVGGFLTEYYSWRWCFYINVPVGGLALFLLWIYLPSEPVQTRRFDFLGFGSLAIAVSSLQLMLDRGTTLDWFESNEICIEAAVSGAAFYIYLVHTFTTRHPLFPTALFRDRNLMTSIVFSFFVAVLLFSSLMLLPLMMQGVLGYSVIHSGQLSVPRGLVMLTILQIMGRLDAIVNRQLLVLVGLAFLDLSFWQMTKFDLSMSGNQIIWSTMLQGVGQGIISVPLATLGFASISQELRPDASALTSLLRNLGGSVGVASIQALTMRNIQTLHTSLAVHINPTNPALASTVPDLQSPEALIGLNSEITRQATMVAYIDDFRLMSLVGLMCFALVLLLRKAPSRGAVD